MSSVVPFWMRTGRVLSRGIRTNFPSKVKVETASDDDDPECLKSAYPNGWNSGTKLEAHRFRGFGVQLVYVLIDAVCVVVSGIIAIVLRFPITYKSYSIGRFLAGQGSLSHYNSLLFLYVALTILCCQWQELYRTPRTRSATDESVAVARAVSLATLLLTAFIYVSGLKIFSRVVVLTCYLLNVLSLAAWRYWKRRIVIRRVEQGIGARNAVIIGAGRIGQALAILLEKNKSLGYRFKGFLDANHSDDPRVLGKIEELARIARKEFIDEVFITIPSERELVKRVALEARLHRLDVKVVPDLFDGLAWNAPVRHLADFPIMDLHWQPIPTLGLFLKRSCDIFLATLGLILCAPLLAILAIWIKLNSAGPVLYRSRRVGKKGAVFTCFKLRTMVQNADFLKDSLRYRNERQGPCFKIQDDPRITSVGQILRKYSLDELPQLWNVLRGDMSLVGPRPHPLDDYERYDVEHLRRLEVKPGITGLWQVGARRDPSFSRNLRLDLEYIDSWNVWLDLRILAKTVAAVLQGEGQ